MLITNAKLITWGTPNLILEAHAVLIEGDRIKDIGPQNIMTNRYPDQQVLDAGGQYVMPGNICAHTHFYGAFARGISIPGLPPRDFPEILSKLWWKLDKSLGEEDVRYSALVCLVDAIRHGTTTLFDHHASPNIIDGSLDIIASAVEQSGLRVVLCYETTDRDGLNKAKAGIAENSRFIQRNTRRELPPTIAASFGLHASLTLSDKTLDLCRSAAPQGTGFHMHAAESEADEYDSVAKSGMRVIDRLQKHGLLGTKTIAAHAVHVDSAEIHILSETGTWVTHQPRSNMNNGVGVAPVESMLRAGVRVGLGNDGFSNAMWEEWKCAYLVPKVWHRDPRRMSGDTLTRIAIYNNAALAFHYFPSAPIGQICQGAFADLIFVDYHPHTPLTPDNLPWHMLFGFHESMITTTIVAGKILMQDRRLLTLDTEAITARAKEQAIKTWKRFKQQF